MNNNLIIKEEKMNDMIIKQIMEIDETFYKEELSFHYYKERYSDNNTSYCLYDGDKMVGYITKYGIDKSLYNDLINGLYDNDFDFDINLINNDSEIIYISSIVILNEYKKRGYGIKLLDKILEQKNKKYIAMTITDEGFKLANKRMDLIRRVTNKVSVFELTKNDNII